MITAPSPISESEKRDALDAVLNSATFARSAQLRAFLRYVCEAELAGRGSELSEYLIAVEVLGRPKDFSLADDSSVRNRAYELRQRLEKYYLTESPGAAVRIDIPRGGYVPSYTRHPENSEVEPPSRTIPVLLEPARSGPRTLGLWVLAAVLSGLLLGAGVLLGIWMERPAHPAILAEAWGPLAKADNDVLICVATNLHMLIRPHIAPHSLRYPVPADVYPLYRVGRPPLSEGSLLYMEPAQLSVPLGDIAGAFRFTNLVTEFGNTYQILPEAEAPITALRDRNALLIGTPVDSAAATVLLRTVPLTIGFNAANQFTLIDQRKSPGANDLFVAQPVGSPVSSVLYGLLTVMPASGPMGMSKRTIIVSGTGSAGVQAALEFFCSPDRMSDLKKLFQKEGIQGFPESYQVVVRCKASGIRLVSYDYATHVVVRK
ncbi:MAG TPA: hypothetical protein VG675_02680 [Bryobacteraceae bacterium]|nr:hypothetical protein [Bryobacteraceae bacterium]